MRQGCETKEKRDDQNRPVDAATAENGDLHECGDVVVNFRHVTAFAFMLTSVSFEQEGHEVLVVAVVVNLAIGDDILGKISDGVGYGNLGLKGGEREGGDRREQPENEHGDEGRVFAAHVILSSPEACDLNSIGSIIDGIEVVTKGDPADDVHGGAGGVVKNVELDGRLAISMDLVRNAVLEGGGDEIDIGVHFTDVVGREGRGDETTHALVVFLTLDPEERSAAEAKEERTKNRGVMVIVWVLCVYVGKSPSIAHNQLQCY